MANSSKTHTQSQNNMSYDDWSRLLNQTPPPSSSHQQQCQLNPNSHDGMINQGQGSPHWVRNEPAVSTQTYSAGRMPPGLEQFAPRNPQGGPAGSGQALTEGDLRGTHANTRTRDSGTGAISKFPPPGFSNYPSGSENQPTPIPGSYYFSPNTHQGRIQPPETSRTFYPNGNWSRSNQEEAAFSSGESGFNVLQGIAQESQAAAASGHNPSLRDLSRLRPLTALQHTLLSKMLTKWGLLKNPEDEGGEPVVQAEMEPLSQAALYRKIYRILVAELSSFMRESEREEELRNRANGTNEALARAEEGSEISNGSSIRRPDRATAPHVANDALAEADGSSAVRALSPFCPPGGAMVYFKGNCSEIVKVSQNASARLCQCCKEKGDKTADGSDEESDDVPNPKVHANSYMAFKDRKEAQEIVRKLGGRGHHIRMMDEPELDDTKVYVANLPPNISETNLSQAVAQLGIVSSVKVLKDPNGNSRGVGFVRMSNEKEAVDVIRSLHNRRLAGCNAPLQARLAYKYSKKVQMERASRLMRDSNNRQQNVRQQTQEGSAEGERTFRFGNEQLTSQELTRLEEAVRRMKASLGLLEPPEGIDPRDNAESPNQSFPDDS